MTGLVVMVRGPEKVVTSIYGQAQVAQEATSRLTQVTVSVAEVVVILVVVTLKFVLVIAPTVQAAMAAF